MNFLRSRIGWVLAVSCLAAYGDGPDDQYIQVYNLIQEADSLTATGQKSLGHERYVEAQSALQNLQAANPAWNEPVVQFRLKYIAEKLRATSSPDEPVTTPPPRGAEASPVTVLQEQIRQLTRDNDLLQAKLKEALAAQPASVDPREISRSTEIAKELQKEVDVLKVRLDQAEAKSDRPVPPALYQEAQKALVEARQKTTEQAAVIASLNLEKQALQSQLQSTGQADQFKSLTEENAGLKQQLSQAKQGTESSVAAEMLARKFEKIQKNLTAEQARNNVLVAEKKILEDRLDLLNKNRDTELAVATRSLEKELASAKSEAQAGSVAVAALRESLRSAETDKASWEREKGELETQLSAARSSLASEKLATFQSEAAAKSNAQEIKRLEQERNELKGRLDVVSEELRDARAQLQLAAAQSPRGTRADLNVAFVGPGRMSDKHASSPSPARQKTDESVVNLTHLAAIQLDQNRLTEADSTLREALALDPKSAMSLLLLGELHIRRHNFEAALQPLSQAAQLDPENAEAHNYLGLTLMEKGLGQPAEFALLRAIRLSPHYGDAHFNLTVFYTRQRPPSYNLAREHYRQALDAGHSSDADLERLLQYQTANTTAR